MLARVHTAKQNLPLTQKQVLKQREQLRYKTRQLLSGNGSRSSQRNISTAFITATSRSNGFLKPQTQQRHRHTPDYNYLRPDSTSQIRPFTQSSGRCHRSHTPLSVIKTHSKCQSKDQLVILNQTPINHQRKSKFLKRGSSIDKAVISIILKNKLSKQVCAPAYSYCDANSNQNLVEVISKQIPRGIRDVVGAEQMFRMSHILTGTQFKSISLTQRLNQAIAQTRTHGKNRKNSQQDDNITLKSIKRW